MQTYIYRELHLPVTTKLRIMCKLKMYTAKANAKINGKQYAGIFIIFRALNFVRYCVMLCRWSIRSSSRPLWFINVNVTENCVIRRLQYFHCIYVFLLLCLCILIVCMFCSVYSVFIVPNDTLRLP
jgi:hypothetical protein